MVKDKYNLNLSFVNHLQIILNRDPQVKKISMNLSDKILKKELPKLKIFLMNVFMKFNGKMGTYV